MSIPEPSPPAASRLPATGPRLAPLPLLAALPLAGAAVLIAAGGALAQVPLGRDSFGDVLPFTQPTQVDADAEMPRLTAVETFDPVARAQLLARELPLLWTGTYQPFGSPQSMPVQLRLAAPRSIGQMVDLRGEMRVGEAVSPVQGNLNARSDQLDLLLLRPVGLASLEPGGVFTGLQSLTLAGWQASRLINPGGRLELSPEQRAAPAAPAVTPAEPIRGLW